MIKHKTRLTINDSFTDIIIKLSEGNPGAVSVVTEMMRKDDWDNDAPGFTKILLLDSMGIYGDKIWMLYNDCCDRDLDQMNIVLCNWQMGKLTTQEISLNLSEGRGKPFNNLVPLDELYED